MGREGKTIGSGKLCRQVVSKQLSALDCLVAFDWIVHEGNPTGITRPQSSNKETIVSKPHPLGPMIQIVDTVCAVHVKPVCTQQYVPALNSLTEAGIQR